MEPSRVLATCHLLGVPGVGGVKGGLGVLAAEGTHGGAGASAWDTWALSDDCEAGVVVSHRDAVKRNPDSSVHGSGPSM